MKRATRPQYHRLRRILEMIREGTRSGLLPNCGDFRRELEVSRRTLMRDLEFLRDDERAPIAYEESRRGFRLGSRELLWKHPNHKNFTRTIPLLYPGDGNLRKWLMEHPKLYLFFTFSLPKNVFARVMFWASLH